MPPGLSIRNYEAETLPKRDRFFHVHLHKLERQWILWPLIDEPVRLERIGPRWPISFAKEADLIQIAADGLGGITHLAHIGATAVPGCIGKPILDILVGLEDHRMAQATILASEHLGFTSIGESGVPGRWGLHRRKCGTIPVNIAIVAHGGQRWTQAIAFRNRLIADRAAAEFYEAAKQSAVASGAKTLLAYSRAKDRAIEAVLGSQP